LRGGILNKARRGELKSPIPVGLVYDPQDRVVLDPDRQVQQALRTFFATFEQTGAACATVKYFRDQGLLFPRRLRRGIRRGELVWAQLVHSRALQVLHNPRYAGAFFHGRTHMAPGGDGHMRQQKQPIEDWHTLLPGAHDGYITWDQYQRNQKRLRENAQAHGGDRRQSPPGEGPALLQGLVLCSVCGQRMTVRYHVCKAGLNPSYVCQREGIEHAQRICQSIPGTSIDTAIGDLLLEMMTPVTLEVALAVQHELQQRLDDADRLRQQQVERARYEADLAQRRYLQVDPNNRLVADALEADWNDKLRTLTQAQDNCEQQKQADRALVDDESRQQILALAADFPRLWRDSRTSDRERKRIVRLLIEDVTLSKGESITARVRFKGGATQTRIMPLPQPAWMLRQTRPEVVAEIDRLLDQHTEGEIAPILNAGGYRSGEGLPFTRLRVWQVRRAYRLKSRFRRLREAGLLTAKEVAGQLGICNSTVKRWRRVGLLKGFAYNDKHEYLYEPVGQNGPRKHPGYKYADRRRFPEVVPQTTEEVQDEA
jgi:DNA invertase Pin-like site-specific DNA recombinase